ncbi:MAG: hypothetical protein H8E91_04420 [Planctomycetes bacterium]|nr:hypothetical protein [Planctomycetota bacterium]
MGFRCLQSCSFLIALCITTSFLYAGTSADYTEAALRKLKTATQQQRNGEHLANLSALRSLHDPALKPFFYNLVQHNTWSIQVHAVLGLAELSEDGLIDPWLVQQVSPLAREQLIIKSLRDNLFSLESIQSLLDWSLLEPNPTLLLVADLHSKGLPPDPETIKELVNNSDLGIATAASLLSENSKTISEVMNRFRRGTSRERRIALTQVLQIIQQYGTLSATQWLVTLLESPTFKLSDRDLQHALSTLLKHDPTVGMEHWNDKLPSEPSKLEQVRFVLMLMDAEIQLDEDIAKKLHISTQDGIPYALYLAGIESPENLPDSDAYTQLLLDLANRGHSRSTEWVFKQVKKIPSQNAESFYTSLAMLPEDENAANAKRRNLAVISFQELLHINPKHALGLLRSAKDDSQQQELMLLAMLQQQCNELLEREVTSIRRIGVGRPDAMALLLAARGTSPLSESDQRLLGLIAASGAAIGSPLETQAAWLYLRRMGMTEQALAAATTSP